MTAKADVARRRAGMARAPEEALVLPLVAALVFLRKAIDAALAAMATVPNVPVTAAISAAMTVAPNAANRPRRCPIWSSP